MDEKIDNQLNYSLETDYEDRIKSENLNTGYNIIDKQWELIVRITDDGLFFDELKRFQTEYDRTLNIRSLTGGYIIVQMPEDLIVPFSELRSIVFIERPTRLTIEASWTKEQFQNIRFTNLRRHALSRTVFDNLNLSGNGVIISFIDSGIDVFNRDFQNSDGTTRILRLWDQSTGIIYSSEEINQALRLGPIRGREIVNSFDVSGHGTHVAGIACGNGNGSNNRYRGVAPKASIIAVKLGNNKDAFPGTARLMEAIDFSINSAIELSMPLVINLSYGNNYGPHDGQTLIERYIEESANRYRCSFCVGMGNEATKGIHVGGELSVTRSEYEQLSVGVERNAKHELFVGGINVSLNMQIYRQAFDDMNIYLVMPDGNRRLISENNPIGILQSANGQTNTFVIYKNTKILIYNSPAKPYETKAETFVEMIPLSGNRIDEGIFTIELEAVRILDGRYDIWIGTSSANAGFLKADEASTLTIPATCDLVISVGAYNSFMNKMADFSGRGPVVGSTIIKPEIVAPGVDIVAAQPNSSYASKSGTSMATAFASGTSALLMEYGIVNGNDEYMYGQKLKAQLISLSKEADFVVDSPNYISGYGVI